MQLFDDIAVGIGFNKIVHFEVACDEVLLEFSWIVNAFEVKDT